MTDNRLIRKKTYREKKERGYTIFAKICHMNDTKHAHNQGKMRQNDMLIFAKDFF